MSEAVKVGDKGVQVERIQARLQNLGYEIEVDGFYGSKTAEVVRRFQRDAGLEETGEVDLKTCCALLPEDGEPQPAASPSAPAEVAPASSSGAPSPKPEDAAASAAPKPTTEDLSARDALEDAR